MAISTIVMGLTALVFCTWAVSVAGIAATQNECVPGWSVALAGVNGFSINLPCMKLFRYYWFIVILEFTLIIGLGLTLAIGAFNKTRMSWLGLLCIATLLYIQMTDTTLTAVNLVDSVDSDSRIQNRFKTWFAGNIMTATINCLLIIALGMTPEEAAKAVAEGEKATAV